MDRDLLELRRRTLEGTDDLLTRYRYRIACLRSGRAELAGSEVGDVVLVDEVESPWVRGQWRGEVCRVFEAGDKYVRPLDQNLNYRVKPPPEYAAKGLYLTREDQTNLLTPVAPGARVHPTSKRKNAQPSRKPKNPKKRGKQ